jgi:MoxR-like ATPase
MDTAVDKVIGLMIARFTELVPQLVSDNLALLSRVEEIKINKLPPVKIDTAHKLLPTIVRAVAAGTTPYLVGPAGSGKTTLAQQVCKVMKRRFYMEARVTSDFKLIGFTDAAGHVVRTQFREAYEHGGGFLFDEVDASDPDAMTAFNAALANGVCAFPDGLVAAHKDFFAIAAGNTFGRGADRQYVGRNQLDAATLDRFQTYEVDYDEQLELTLAGNADWTRYVQKVRAAVEAEKVRHVVSPRASIAGAKLLAAGEERSIVEECCVWKGLDAATRQRVTARMGSL